MMLAHQVMDRIGSAASAGGIMPSTHVAPSGARWPCAACALVVRARGESTGSGGGGASQPAGRGGGASVPPPA
eukprot:COSAG04_NODE_16905_length_485_cov_1.300518_1_plen_72_part_01